MRQRRILSAGLLLCLAFVGRAGVIQYAVNVDTSSISGTTGSFDLQFNPGPLVTQPASLLIKDFGSDGTLAGGPVPAGDVSGTLPSTLLFDNIAGFNDYFQGFTFGSNISFLVWLYGPAVSAPDQVSTSGSTFAFSMFSDPAGTIPTLTSDTVNGFAAMVNINLDGTTTSTSLSPVTTLGGPTVVPEPNTLFMLAGLFGVSIAMRRRLG